MEILQKTWPRRLVIPLITVENRKLFFWPAGFFVYLSYTITAHNPVFEPWHPPLTAIDRWVPFLPGTIWLYLSHVGLMFSGWWYMVRGPGCTRAFWAVVLSAFLSTLIFLFFPTELPRRTLEGIDTDMVSMAGWAFLMSADAPTNCFPSMHVAGAAISAVALGRASTHWRVLGPVWAACIALTTLTTEQHVFIDVIGGLLLAWLCITLVDRYLVVEPMPAVDAEGHRP
jgi:membrane-associated phospholipid phosphatase